MRIVHVVPGSGGTFYCENCLRDTAVVSALQKKGAEVIMVPLYLPLFGHETNLAGGVPIFFGGVNTYLQQHLPLFRHTPRWIDGLFDSPWILEMAARQAGSTSPRGLGEMTVSMLRGDEGRQAKELDRLTRWLAEEARPDVVHLSNALLLGLARPIREKTGAAIVCSLQDEAPWIDAMEPPWAERVWETMKDRARDVDAFVSVSRSYADHIAGRLDRSKEEIHVVPIGIDAGTYEQAPLDFSPPVIGYIARLSECSGLGVLVDAFAALKGESSFGEVKLKVTGGKTREDDPFLATVRKRLSQEGIDGDVEIVEDFGFESRRSLLRSCSLFSMPSTTPSAFGLPVLEAMAAGVPVIQPDRWAFPEIVGATGGGLLYDSADGNGLRDALACLLENKERSRELGRKGREGVKRLFALDTMAGRFVDLYGSVAPRGKR